MTSTPAITFKAGKCNQEGTTVKCVRDPGYLYLWRDEELFHFCWRPRNAPVSDPELELFLVPGECTFKPYTRGTSEDGSVESPTTGRIFVLTFEGSPDKKYFWMQSKTQHPGGKLNWFSSRDQKLGEIVNSLLQGEQLSETQEAENSGRRPNNDDDDHMDIDETEDMETGGAGQDATGGDPRQEGELSREGGSDGARAPSQQDANQLVQNFLNSIRTNPSSTPKEAIVNLPELLTPATTIPYIDSADASQIDHLCSFLPPELFVQPHEGDMEVDQPQLSTEQKKDIVKRALRSPQFHQSVVSFTIALRDGGLPMVAEALGLKVENGGMVRGSSMALGGAEAIEVFINGVKRTVEKK
ncbi:hypothetical protein K470DRAFT_212140 [Piedraia hortae CBS 480.64]|uniref:Pru domain-containing protein n=1 Tax=Piedraia hortae CBS 480.64 TaxID=1314780 RepID=A0A6A7C725_9PEZI|nr:hypothetical protein K470DRAFT_212140 [Piedraia hortae CBS 480.64]